MRELRRTREDQSRPFVVVDIQPGAGRSYFNLVVENIGTTAARDVRIVFDPPIEQSGADGFELAQSGLLTDGIQMMPPGRRITAFFDSEHEVLSPDRPSRYDVTVSLNDARGRPQADQTYAIDMSYLRGLAYIEELGPHDAAKALGDLNKSMKAWAGVDGRLKVGVVDEDRRADNAQVELALTGRRRSMREPAPPEWQMALGRNVFVRSIVRYLRERRTGRAG